MDPFATVVELKARCDWTFDTDEERSALGYLEEASDLARAHGRAQWTALTAPRLVKNIVISAVRRYMRNPEGYMQSRAGDETLGWRDAGQDSATIVLSAGEIKLIRGLAGGGGIQTAQMTAWGNTSKTTVGYVPVGGNLGEKPFPYYASDTEPWA